MSVVDSLPKRWLYESDLRVIEKHDRVELAPPATWAIGIDHRKQETRREILQFLIRFTSRRFVAFSLSFDGDVWHVVYQGDRDDEDDQDAALDALEEAVGWGWLPPNEIHGLGGSVQ